MSEETLLTPDEVANRLKISRFTVMDYLRAGRIKAIKVGRLWRIRESDLEAFLREPHKEENPQEPQNTTKEHPIKRLGRKLRESLSEESIRNKQF